MKRILSVFCCALLLAYSPASFTQAPPLGEDEAIGLLPGKQWSLHALKGTAVEFIAQITGEESMNRTQSRFGVWGVDLGSMAAVGDTVYMFGGDTFGDERNSHWRSNVLFMIRDEDPSDGLTIADAVTDRQGRAKELLRSLKREGVEVTVIPTNLFAVGDILYCIYMSVSHWGDPGRWDCSHSGLARSLDLGHHWEKLDGVRWPGDSNFIQTADCRIGDTIYFFGIPAGRFGGAALMKVPADRVEDFESYSYYAGRDRDGSPLWITGSGGISRAVCVIPPPVGEISALYNSYLGNFLVTYLSEPKRGIVMREGITPFGPWGSETLLASAADYPALYGAYMHPKYTQHGGRTFYFAMSRFFPLYNILWMRADLP